MNPFLKDKIIAQARIKLRQSKPKAMDFENAFHQCIIEETVKEILNIIKYPVFMFEGATEEEIKLKFGV